MIKKNDEGIMWYVRDFLEYLWFETYTIFIPLAILVWCAYSFIRLFTH